MLNRSINLELINANVQMQIEQIPVERVHLNLYLCRFMRNCISLKTSKPSVS